MAKDVDLFTRAMAGVKPLVGRPATGRLVTTTLAGSPSKPEDRPLAPPGRPPGEGQSHRRPLPAPRPAPDLGTDDGAFDRAVDRSLSRGRLEPQTTLDLHGLTLAQAERAVTRFLEQAAQQDCRVALIVTGKGFRRQDGRLIEGRIRAEFVGWLNRPDNRARVHAVRPAHPRHGGTGAFYVLLRRRSSASRRSLRDTPQR